MHTVQTAPPTLLSTPPTKSRPQKVNWIALQCDRLDVDLLAQLAHQDGSNKSATVRRLIREEARRRGILSFDNSQHQI